MKLIDADKGLISKIQRETGCNFITAQKIVDSMPTVEERKAGKWLVKDNGNGGKYVECPFCGALAPCTEFADRTVWKYSKFCYDCGNELRGAENDC